MSKPDVFAGIDAGHIDTKAVVMRGQQVIGYGCAPTRLDPAAAARDSLQQAMAAAGLTQSDIAAICSTGIYRDVLGPSGLSMTAAVPEHMAAAAGALFFDIGARTLIGIGGNIHQLVRFDGNGTLIDVAQNDKCADGLGIFFTTAARSLGLNEAQMSELATGVDGGHALAIQCSLSALSDATDLTARGFSPAEVAAAVIGYAVERVSSLCLAFPVSDRILVAGGLARSSELVSRLQTKLGHDLIVPDRPEYLCAVGAVMRSQQ